MFYALRAFHSMGWYAEPVARELARQLSNFERVDFESATFGALSGVIMAGKQSQPAECSEKCLPWIECLKALFNGLVHLEEEKRLGALKVCTSQHLSDIL